MAQMEAMVNEAREREGSMEEELPQGQGEFGLSENNPIPFTSIAESRKYLENLKTEFLKKRNSGKLKKLKILENTENI